MLGVLFLFCLRSLRFGCMLWLELLFSVLILFYNFVFFEKMRFSRKKGLRVSVSNRRTPLTGGAEAHNGTPDGLRRSGTADLLLRGGTKKF